MKAVKHICYTPFNCKIVEIDGVLHNFQLKPNENSKKH